MIFMAHESPHSNKLLRGCQICGVVKAIKLRVITGPINYFKSPSPPYLRGV